MSKAAKNILTLNHDEAMDFFMKSEQYHGFELPKDSPYDSIINKETLKDNTPVITFRETRMYNDYLF